jgi:hypothetical protein
MKIWLDLDGVLADFTKAHNKCKDDFWENHGSRISFWCDEIELMPDADAIVQFCCERVRANNVGILSSGCCWSKILRAYSFTGKVLWVERHFPQLLGRLLICTDKTVLGSPGNMLIDDHPENIRGWKANGGIGVLYDGKLKSLKERIEAAL